MQNKMNEHTKQAIEVFFTPEFQSAEQAGFQCFLMGLMVFSAVQNIFGDDGLIEFIKNILEEMDNRRIDDHELTNMLLKVKSTTH